MHKGLIPAKFLREIRPTLFLTSSPMIDRKQCFLQLRIIINKNLHVLKTWQRLSDKMYDNHASEQ